MISITPDFNMDEIEAYIQQQEEAFYDEVVDGLRQKGRMLVDKAISKATDPDGFNNITYNLRSSIGMCIVDERGLIVETYFPFAKGAHGNTVGKGLAETLAIYARDIDEMTMVFVAGEEYAGFVEAKGKDVIKFIIGDNIGPELEKLLGA